MAKSKKKQPQKSSGKKPQDDTIHLEDTLTQATDAVRETFTKHKTTLVVVLVVLVGGFGLWKLIGARNVAVLDDVNAEVFEAKQDPATAVAKLTELAKEYGDDYPFVRVELAIALQEDGQTKAAAETWEALAQQQGELTIAKTFEEQAKKLRSAGEFVLPEPTLPPPTVELPPTDTQAPPPLEGATPPAEGSDPQPTSRPAGDPAAGDGDADGGDDADPMDPAEAPPIPSTDEPTTQPGGGR